MFLERAGIVGLVLLGIALTAAAQENQEKKEQDLKKPKEIVITPSRLEEEKQDVASSVTVITAQDYEKRQHRFIVDALREVPALDVVQSGVRGGLTTLYTRGTNEGHTLVLVDGIEVNDPMSIERSFNFANLTPTNIDRVEVLRGPQSVLYGSNAMGGVVNVLTRRGRGDPRVNFLVEGGSFATLRTNAALSGGSDKVHYSVGASRSQTSGISAASKEFGNSEKDGYRNESFSTRIGVTPSEIVEADLFIRGTEGHAEVDNGSGALQDDPNHVADSHQWFIRAAPRLKLLDGLWEQTLAVSHTSASFEDDNPPDARTGGAYTLSSFDATLIDLDWQHNFFLHGANILTVGAEFEEEAGESSTVDTFFGFNSFIPKQAAWTRGAYVQDRIHLWDRLTLTGGARIDAHEDFGTHATWRATGAYFIKESSTKLRGTVGTGFKAPSLFQLFSSFGNPDLEPEESLGWDVGIDQELAAWGLTASVTYFRNEFEELIDFEFPPGRYVNIGRAETSGVEVALQVRPFKDFELRASYTRTDTEDKSTDEEFLRRPKHKAGIQGFYAVTEAIQVNAAVLYVGEKDDVDFSSTPPRVTLDDYATVNVAASWRIDERFELFARGENIFDKEYEELFGFGTPGAAVYVGASASF